jgi:hypothetical protein
VDATTTTDSRCHCCCCNEARSSMQAESSRRVEKLLGALGTTAGEKPKQADAETLRWTFGGCRCCAAAAPSAATAGRAPRTIHQLREEEGHATYTYSTDNPLSATIQSGDLIEVQCWDSSEHDLADPDTW